MFSNNKNNVEESNKFTW